MARFSKITAQKKRAGFAAANAMSPEWDDRIVVASIKPDPTHPDKTLIWLEMPSTTREKIRRLAKSKRRSPEKMLQQWIIQRVREELIATKL